MWKAYNDGPKDTGEEINMKFITGAEQGVENGTGWGKTMFTESMFRVRELGNAVLSSNARDGKHSDG